MTTERFDIIVVGGGPAGAAVAHRMARAGAKVLLLERERRFRDRVRGDVVYPWGVREARSLGIHPAMTAGAARELRYWRTGIAGVPARPARDLRAETGESALVFHHPELQQALVGAAAEAGAAVWRPATATGLTRSGGGVRVSVRTKAEGGSRPAQVREVEAALVVAADGRGSALRRRAGFATERDAPRLVFAGVLLRGVRVEQTEAPRDTAQLHFHPSRGLLAMLLPLDGERTRAYAGYHVATGRRPEVGASLEEFVALSRAAGAPPASFTPDLEQIAPLAAFDGADVWVQHPYRAGVALVGDAAAASDPSFGSGVALALLGARLLTDRLLQEGELTPAAVERAGHAYAHDFAAGYGALHRHIDWLTTLYRRPGPAGDELRARLYPLHAAEPWRSPDVVGVGPEAPSDEEARRRFFGEDVEAPAGGSRVDGGDDAASS